MNRSITIKDVVKKAGVSITTVSFVLNRRSDMVISEKVTRKVLKVAQELNYHRNAMAAGLAGRRTQNIGLIFYQHGQTISNQFYSFVIEGIIKEGVEKSYNLLFSFVESSYKDYQDLPKIIREKNVDGLLLIEQVHPKMIKEIQTRKIPVVLIDPRPAVKGVNSIRIDNIQGGFLAAEHLIRLGHKAIGLLTIADQRPSIIDREKGYRQALEKNKLAFRPEYVFRNSDMTFSAGYEGTKQALRKNNKITAFFCVNDEVAAGALRAARELGCQVPRQLSVVGFDDIT